MHLALASTHHMQSNHEIRLFRSEENCFTAEEPNITWKTHDRLSLSIEAHLLLSHTADEPLVIKPNPAPGGYLSMSLNQRISKCSNKYSKCLSYFTVTGAKLYTEEVETSQEIRNP